MVQTQLKKFQKATNTKYFFGTGRRKSSTARVRIIKGKGDILINEKEILNYFSSKFFKDLVLSPIKLVGLDKKYDISILVSGGGKKTQAEASRLGISRALIKSDNELKTTLKKSGFLTQDAREKERKKPGLKRARRAPQWQKR